MPGRRARLGALAAALAGLVAASLLLGARPLPLLRALAEPDSEAAALLALRIPRTLLGLLAGAALGVSGALMQALTRNPLADPGLLGISMGALLAMLLAAGFLAATGLALAAAALLGAGLAGLLVQGAALAGGGLGAALRLTMAGVAVSAMLGGVAGVLLLLDPARFDRLRGWMTGALATPDLAGPAAVAPLVGLGLALALLAGRGLTLLSLGEAPAAALGAPVRRLRLAAGLAATLLAGAATAAAGPVAFLGLMAPQLARRLLGADQRWILAGAALLGPALLLAADILGRLLAPPGEIPAGILVALGGAPCFLVALRRVGQG
ncbi:iron chelate uptake ABC transporter family permease subunit [Roseomonas sp. 18066]|uniref:iron chelate uptake ABC transporter family permease subunit n=1 Tax=Roseomonas sp. 18066 TaxID=2681412 RepID=UPI00135CD088|nr:iron chelate uptake ABC transporter family permease subunit [Roseomonas sp. 18066]